MMGNMQVSIIIPVYNVAPYIEACLVSVMRQTYAGSMECLIVDDCGTDDSIGIAERMLEKYDGAIQFRILHHTHNRGLSAARNTGTEAAAGEYLYYLDSDDEIAPDCIEKLMGQVRLHPEVEMVQGNICCHLLEGGEMIALDEVAVPYAETNEAVRTCFYQIGQMHVNVWNKLLRRDLIVNHAIYCKEGIVHEDNLWVFYLLKYVQRAAFIEDVTYHYIFRPLSITKGGNKTLRVRSLCAIYSDILAHLTPGYEPQEFAYYATQMADSFFSYVRVVPQFKEVLTQCRSLGRTYGSLKLRLSLTFMSFLAKFKYGSYVWKLVSHPDRFWADAKQRWYNRKDKAIS